MEGDWFVLRLVERIATVIVAGVSIYLGYRLFRSAGAAGEGSAEIKFPGDVKMLVSRVGPGVFFALFGAAVLYASISTPVSISTASDGSRSSSGLGEEQVEFARLEARRHITFLNGLENRLDPALGDDDRRGIARDLAAVRLGLMKGVWAEDWPTFEAFQEWSEGGAPPAQSEGFEGAKAFYEAGRDETP